jgi:hypothetical protein
MLHSKNKSIDAVAENDRGENMMVGRALAEAPEAIAPCTFTNSNSREERKRY